MDGSFVVIFKDDSKNEVFLVLRSDFPVWGLTGGSIEKGETIEEGAIREAKEESGFKVKLERKVGKYKITLFGKKTIHIFEGRRISGTFKPGYPECEGKWFDTDHLPSNMTAISKRMIKDVKNANSVKRYFLSQFSLSDIRLAVRFPRQITIYILGNHR